MAWETFLVITGPVSNNITLEHSKYNYRLRNTASYPVSISIFQSDGNVQTYPIAAQSSIVLSTSMAPNLSRFGSPDPSMIHLERELKNTAPTTPGNFTQPAGTLEIGDSKVVTWGASTDAEGKLAKYFLQASINGGGWAEITQPTTTSYTYVVPTATSVKFRVKAVDAAGLESAYRESALLTVTKPMYYWSKYNIVTTPGTPASYADTAPWEGNGSSAISFNGYATSYSFNASNNTYTTSGPWPNSASVSPGSVAYAGGGASLIKYTATTSAAESIYTVTANIATKNASKNTYSPGSSGSSSPGTLVETLTAVDGTYPTNGISGSYWYVRGSRVSQSIAPPSPFTTPAPSTVLLPKQALTLAFGASTASSLSTYEVESRYNAGAWTAIGTHSNTLTRPFTVTSDKSLKTVEFRVRAKNTSNVYSDWVYSETFAIQHNQIPTITLETANNKTLYENDTFIMEGAAIDTDVNDILNVKYQIGSGEIRPIETAISKGVAIPYRKVLTFKSGILYENGKPITDTLSDGSPYTLKVWAEDDQGGKSTVEERIFFVVPNRPPALSVDPIADQSGLINPDTISINGASSDPDGNDVVVKYRINEQAAVQIHSGPAGPWSFDVSLKLLKDGENIIVVEVTDTHNFKSSKTIKLNKTANLTPLSKSVQRYTIVPPAGTAQGVLLWLERDELQDVAVEISMTNGTEQEQFKPMTFDTSGPANVGSVEDFFKYRSDTPAEKIAIKLSWTGDKPIFKVSGALTQ